MEFLGQVPSPLFFIILRSVLILVGHDNFYSFFFSIFPSNQGTTDTLWTEFRPPRSRTLLKFFVRITNYHKLYALGSRQGQGIKCLLLLEASVREDECWYYLGETALRLREDVIQTTQCDTLFRPCQRKIIFSIHLLSSDASFVRIWVTELRKREFILEYERT